MPARFTFGLAGSGKTRWCLSQCVELARRSPLGPPVFLIVPAQATLSVERLTTQQLHAVSRVRVLSPEGLIQHIAMAAGLGAQPDITDRARRLLVYRALLAVKDKLQYFRPANLDWSTAAAIDDTLRELELAGHPADATLASLTDPTRTDLSLPAALSARLQDLCLVATQYATSIARQADSFTRTAAATTAVASLPGVDSWHVFIDGFLDFTGPQRALFAQLALRCPVNITLLLDPSSPVIDNPLLAGNPDSISVTGRVERAYSRIHHSLTSVGLRPLPPHRLPTPPSKAAHRLIASHPDSDGPTLHYLAAADLRHECTVAAAAVAAFLRDGTPPHEILLLARDLETYRTPLLEAFREYSIPTFLDARRRAAGHPLFAAIFILLRIARETLTTDHLISLLHTGLCQIPSGPVHPLTIAAIQRHAHTTGLPDTAWFDPGYWTAPASLSSTPSTPSTDAPSAPTLAPQSPTSFLEDPAPTPVSPDSWPAIVTVRNHLLPALTAFLEAARAPGLTFGQFATSLITCIRSLGCFDTLESWCTPDPATTQPSPDLPPPDPELAEIHRQTRQAVLDLLAEVSSALAEEPVANAGLLLFDDLLLAAGNELEVAVTPASLQQVQIGQIDRTRTARARAVIVVGMSAGQFPRPPASSTILGEADRARLTSAGIQLSDSSLHQLLYERLLAYLAFTRSTETLILTRPTLTDRGQPVEPSPFLDLVSPLITPSPLSLPQSPRAALLEVTSFLHTLAAGDDKSLPPTAPVHLYNELLQLPALSNQLRSASRWLLAPPTTAIPPDLLPPLLPTPVELSASHIEAFAACPYKCFADRMLSIRPDTDRRSSPPSRRSLQLPVTRSSARSVPPKLPAQPPPFSAARKSALSYSHRLVAAAATDHPLSLSPHESILFRSRAADASSWLITGIDRIRSVQPNRSRPHLDAPSTLLSITTPTGLTQVRLRGYPDLAELIFDPTSNQSLLVVSRFTSKPTNLNEFQLTHGLSIRILLDLIATLDSLSSTHPPSSVIPAASLQLPADLSFDRLDEPPDPDAPEDFLPESLRPAGIVSKNHAIALDPMVAAGLSVLGLKFTQKGELARTSRILRPTEEFLELLDQTREVCQSIVTSILSGHIAVHPYRHGQTTPCSTCHLRPVCQFDPATHHYRYLEDVPSPQTNQSPR